MKLIHLSDLHLGKRVSEFSMLEDQKYILTKIINVIDDEKPDGVIIAGDVYDKSVPSAEAVQLFDDFLVRLAKRGLKVFAISGNHDSPERIAFGSRLMDQSGVYLSPVYDGKVEPVILADEYGPVHVYMLPFLKPSQVKRYFIDEEIVSYTDAIRAAIKNMPLDTNVQNAQNARNARNARNILITHLFVTGADRCDSEEVSVGGYDNVDVSVFDAFDYVALGHIHSPQSLNRDTVRYCGTPLKYSFSEARQQKSVTVIILGEKDNVSIHTVSLEPKLDMHEIKGKYAEITLRSYYELTTYQNDYMHITLTDEEDIPDAIGKLRAIYHNIMKLDYDNKRTRSNSLILGADSVERKTPPELFGEFYEKQNNQPMTAEQQSFTANLIEEIWEADAS